MTLRPLPLAAISFSLGILLVESGSLYPLAAALPMTVVMAGPPTTLVGLRPLARAVGLALLVGLAGGASRAVRGVPPDLPLPAGTVTCIGRVTGVRTLSGGRTEVAVLRAGCRSASDSLFAGILLYPDGPAPSAGAVLQATGTLGPPAESRNPGEASRRRSAARRGFAAVLRIERGSSPHVLREPPAVLRLAARMRNAVRHRIRSRYGGPVEPVMAALLSGDSSSLPDRVRSDFRRAGLAHVLAVSGLHVGILAGVVLVILTSLLGRMRVPFGLRTVLATLVLLLLLALLLVIVGPKASVARAALMGTLLAVRRVLQRPGPGLRDVLALAMILQLAADPSALYEVGFQLSHAAVLGLSFVKKSPGWFLAGMKASFAATVATAPLVAWHFGPVPLAGLVMNLVGVPLTGVAVTAGLSGLVPGGSALASVARWAAEALMGSARFGAGVFGGLVIHVPRTALPGLLLVPLAVRGLVRSRRGRIVTLALCMASSTLRLPDGRLRIVFLDVGQGDAMVLRLPSGGTAVVDTGPALSSSLLRFLSREGIDRIDHVIMTHDHADHAGGLQRLAATLDIGRVISTTPLDGVSSRIVSAGDTLDLGTGLRAYVLAPTGRGEGNETSLVLAIRHGTTGFLLLGDAESAAELELVDAWPSLLSADVVKVGHHGSKTSSLRPLVRQAVRNGTLAVVSVGEKNRYGHPDPRVIGRWQGAGARVLLTSRHGAVCVESDGRRIAEGCHQGVLNPVGAS